MKGALASQYRHTHLTPCLINLQSHLRLLGEPLKQFCKRYRRFYHSNFVIEPCIHTLGLPEAH